jgi:hypothetical protein
MEDDRHRVLRPLPALREARLEAPVADRVEVRADLGEPVEEEVVDLLPLDAGDERGEEDVGVGRGGDDDGSADVAASRSLLDAAVPTSAGGEREGERREGRGGRVAGRAGARRGRQGRGR